MLGKGGIGMTDLAAVIFIFLTAACAFACVYSLIVTWCNQKNIEYLVDKLNEVLIRVNDLEIVTREWERMQ